jgi:hypothetical protein
VQFLVGDTWRFSNESFIDIIILPAEREYLGLPNGIERCNGSVSVTLGLYSPEFRMWFDGDDHTGAGVMAAHQTQVSTSSI